MERVGIDIGFAECKIALDGGARTSVFPSVLGLAEARTTIDVGLGGRHARRKTIEYDGVTYYLGSDALIESRMIANSQDAGRIGSTEERVLALAALASLGVHDALVVTGLPVMWWNHRCKLIDSWTGSHRVKWNGKPFEITINEVKAVWQPFGSFYARFLDGRGMATASERTMLSGFGIVDVGGNTTDLSGVLNLKPITRWSRGIQIGVGDALEAVSAEIEQQYGVHRPVAELSAAMRNGGKIAVYRNEIDITPLVEARLSALADEVTSVASRLWGQADRFHSVLITGGGAALMGKALSRAFPVNAEILPNPGMANAVGFARYAQRRCFKLDREYCNT